MAILKYVFFSNVYRNIDRFLIRTPVKYPEILKGNNFKISQPIFFLNLAQYFSMGAIFQCHPFNRSIGL
jgi:hypothetical protein